MDGRTALVREVLGDEKAVVLSGRKDRARLSELGHRDAILFGLRRDVELVGWLMVADRVGNVVTFTEDDRRVFEALGNHAGVALRNSTLLERLRVEVVLELDRRDAVIVRNTIDLAHQLSLRIVAEGVEDAATQAMLTRFGCDLAQGYYFCRPVPAAEILPFARSSALEHELGEMRRESVLRTQDGGPLGIVADALHHQQR